MDISATSYRILKYLDSHKGENYINSFGNIKSHARIFNEPDFDESKLDLYKRGFIDMTKSDASILPAGSQYLKSINEENLKIAYEDIFDNYEHALLRFLYNNNWGVRIEEFPEIFKTKAPDAGMYPEGNLHQFLYTWIYKTQKETKYYLNDAGNALYVHLNKKKAEKPSPFIAITDNSKNVVASGSAKVSIDSNLKDSQNDGEVPSEELTKESLKWTKKQTYWTIFSAIIAIILWILQQRCTEKF